MSYFMKHDRVKKLQGRISDVIMTYRVIKGLILVREVVRIYKTTFCMIFV